MNVLLQSTAIDLDNEVVVTAQREGQVAAINQQLTASSIKNVVSSERIQEVPDANAAESISRLPGLSLVRNAGEGNNVVVRGLAPKYNKTTINGITVPSSDSNERTTDLSMISSENLSGIEVYKALTPDMEGDAIGGTVNLQLAKAKQKPNRYVRVYGAYNAQEQDYRQYKIIANWSQRAWNDKIGIQASVNSELRNRSSDDLLASYTLGQPREGQPTPLRLTGATVGDTEEYRRRNGANLILDYTVGKWEFMLSNFYNQTNRDIGHRKTEFSGTDMNTNSIISNPERNINLMTNILDSKLLLKKLQIDLTLSHSYTENNLLHNTTLEFLQDRSDIPIVDFETVRPADLLNDIVPDSASNLRWAEHDENKVNERSYLAGFDLKLPYQMNRKIAGELKFGARYRQNKLAELYKNYFDAFWNQKNSDLPEFDRQYIFHDLRYKQAVKQISDTFFDPVDLNPLEDYSWEQLPNRTFRIVPEDNGTTNQIKAIIKGSEISYKKFLKVSQTADSLYQLLEPKNRVFFNDNLRLPAHFMMYLNESLNKFCQAYISNSDINNHEYDQQVLLKQALQAAFNARQTLYQSAHDQFKTWYSEESIFDLDDYVDRINQTLKMALTR